MDEDEAAVFDDEDDVTFAFAVPSWCSGGEHPVLNVSIDGGTPAPLRSSRTELVTPLSDDEKLLLATLLSRSLVTQLGPSAKMPDIKSALERASMTTPALA